MNEDIYRFNQLSREQRDKNRNSTIMSIGDADRLATWREAMDSTKAFCPNCLDLWPGDSDGCPECSELQ